jgi:hypothetical protein
MDIIKLAAGDISPLRSRKVQSAQGTSGINVGDYALCEEWHSESASKINLAYLIVKVTKRNVYLTQWEKMMGFRKEQPDQLIPCQKPAKGPFVDYVVSLAELAAWQNAILCPQPPQATVTPIKPRAPQAERLQAGTAAWLQAGYDATVARRTEVPEVRERYLTYERENWAQNKDKYNAQRKARRDQARQQRAALAAAAAGGAQ